MSENKTASILQRLPIILAVTAASYGLPAQAARTPSAGTTATSTSATSTAKATIQPAATLRR